MVDLEELPESGVVGDGVDETLPFIRPHAGEYEAALRFVRENRARLTGSNVTRTDEELVDILLGVTRAQPFQTEPRAPPARVQQQHMRPGIVNIDHANRRVTQQNIQRRRERRLQERREAGAMLLVFGVLFIIAGVMIFQEYWPIVVMVVSVLIASIGAFFGIYDD